MDRVFCYSKLSLLCSALFRKLSPDSVAAACQQNSWQKQTAPGEWPCKISPALSARRHKASLTLSSSLLTASVLLLCSGGVKAHDSSTEPGIFAHGESAQADLSDQLKQERLPQERVRQSMPAYCPMAKCWPGMQHRMTLMRTRIQHPATPPE